MSERRILRLGSLKHVAQFQEEARSLQIKIPCDREIPRAARRTGRSGFGSGCLQLDSKARSSAYNFCTSNE